MKFLPRNAQRVFKKIPLFNLSKRGKFVLSVLLLTVGLFFSELLTGPLLILVGFVLSVLTVFLLYIALKDDIKPSILYPIIILPFFYTLSFALFYSLIPERLLTRIILILVYSFGLYSLFLSQNIFAISAARTINLVRSARIVSYVLTIFVLFCMASIIFSLRLPVFITPFLIVLVSFLLSFQSLWAYTEDRENTKDVTVYSGFIALMMGELSLILAVWPVTAAIYAIFLTGLFYTYLGLSHTWLEKRLFKSVLWEYVWVGVLSIVFLVLFAKWGI